MTAQMKLLKKASVATVLNPKKGFLASLVPNPGDTSPIMRIVGVAAKVIEGMSTFGEYKEFHGEFRTTVLVGENAGEISMSAKAFLPSPVDALLASALMAQGNDGKGAVEFAFDIGIKHLPAKGDKEASYEYTVATLTETKVSDPLAALVSRIDSPTLALSDKTDVSSEKESEKPASKTAKK